MSRRATPPTPTQIPKSQSPSPPRRQTTKSPSPAPKRGPTDLLPGYLTPHGHSPSYTASPAQRAAILEARAISILASASPTPAMSPPRLVTWTGPAPVIQPYVPAAEALAGKLGFFRGQYIRLDFQALASLGPCSIPVCFVAFAAAATRGNYGYMGLVGIKQNNIAFMAPVPHVGWFPANRVLAQDIYKTALEDVVRCTPRPDHRDQRRHAVRDRLAIEVWHDASSNCMRVSLVFRREYEHLLRTVRSV